ncbi:helix-turn-helix domain-containing protein [Sporanaerobium hydrogeniformans]|uniref:helix-turn-helix domain-containing protein n=1 Tax=Sporanaerobium hydrogeniformans TaxID=3072179 RepID=UPI0015D4DCD3|nr:helix-turn-helix transcriptional regulator [Sporanaerobium hydrogeniformans]
MISYIGLEEILRERGKDRRYLHEVVGLSNDTIAKFKKGESVSVSVLERICLALNCDIGDICKIKKSPRD